MSKIRLSDNHTLSWHEIITGTVTNSLSDYDTMIVQFCREWLQGKTEFTIQTSGSTGTPKTIVLSSEKMRLSAEMTINALKLEKNDNAFICLNTEYIAGKMMLVRSMVAQMNVLIVPPASNPLINISSDLPLDFAAFVPLQLETILNETPEKLTILDRMKAIIIGGATISKKQEELFQQIQAPVYHTFGMTETLSHIALRRINGDTKEDLYRVLNNIHITQDEKGCMIIHSPFSTEPLVTNDVIELPDSYSFKWLGRADNIINSGGIKLYPEKIEKHIEEIFNRLKYNNRFFVYGMPDDKLGQKVVLIIEGEVPSIELLRSEISSSLSKYEKAKAIFTVPQFEETATGKVARGITISRYHIV